MSNFGINSFELPIFWQKFSVITVILIAFYPSLLLAKKTFKILINKMLEIKGKHYYNLFEEQNIIKYLTFSFIGLYLLFWNEILDQVEFFQTKLLLHIKNTVLNLYVTVFITLSVVSALNIYVIMIPKVSSNSKNTAIGLYIHILKIVTYVLSGIILLSIILNISFKNLFASLGAAAAFLTFIFKDTVLGLVTSLQITFQDIVKIGDRIVISDYQIDGVVDEITITVVKIRNFDHTVTTIPTTTFLNNQIKNWRYIEESKARRIKRSFYIDINTIKFCDQELLDKIKGIEYFKNLLDNKPYLFDAKNNISNLLIFKSYITEYLKHNQNIHNDVSRFTFLVRQKETTPYGLPLEIYVFSKFTDFVTYEEVQSEIFDHIFTIIHIFALKIFQYNIAEQK
ncbi:mechanosensitive ion channel family protein [Rickettsia endosymbiont of Cardiosporidium cionae]|uniref:mechanosensitive ion channel family protein n=1 Tax=Rickettsia endosymbiont of Cardiosporidium cionae TaxID=2777155 RepID=UPI00189553E5|nr:mechanosensitive ion channel domain-containing protein [Rickettsia endosymbiont of Cardiosporidium cionae]KAF8818853.1 mechanosensitive ion channel protein [Rickettsia endosymbiont of Cardiosporidium cionae]